MSLAESCIGDRGREESNGVCGLADEGVEMSPILGAPLEGMGDKERCGEEMVAMDGPVDRSREGDSVSKTKERNESAQPQQMDKTRQGFRCGGLVLKAHDNPGQVFSLTERH